jgi:hypothetical protein
MKPLTTVILILGLAAAIVLSIGLWIASTARSTRQMTAASEACMTDPALRRAVGPDARGDAYEKCLHAHGVPANAIPKRTKIAH